MIRKLLIVVFAGLLLGCAPYPYKSYSELDYAIANAETPEEKAYYKGRLERFERLAAESATYFERQQACIDGRVKSSFGTGLWVCKNIKQRNLERQPFKDIEDQVREYRRVKGYCGCYDRGQVLRDLGMGF